VALVESSPVVDSVESAQPSSLNSGWLAQRGLMPRSVGVLPTQKKRLSDVPLDLLWACRW
jgi:hypothetical protein